MKEVIKHFSEPVSKVADNLTNPVSKTIGKTLADAWDLALGSHLTLARNKQDYRQEKKYEDYKAEIDSKVANIPHENLMEGPLHIIGPAIEASRFYIEAEELRKMFINLIVSSMDSTTISEVHPSYTEIIKQLSPLDAKNLELFKEVGNPLPTCEYTFNQGDSNNFKVLKTNVFISNKDVLNIELQSNSITNLIRLGLLESPGDIFITDSDFYNGFDETDLYLNQKKSIEDGISKGELDKGSRIEIEKRLVRLTTLGESFIRVVFSMKNN
ncbi:DUF4393 domain-containing protein [Peribacillus simplex]|uniref:DUF4393 domain-containing protein n=1 Tax=Peribacillus simplex TaxID=1478 RepID=UPI003B8BF7A2